MAFARHVDPASIIRSLDGSEHKDDDDLTHVKRAPSTLTPYSSRYNAQDEIPKFKMPSDGAPVSLESLEWANLC